MEEQNISSPSELKETPKNTVPPKAEEKLSEAQQEISNTNRYDTNTQCFSMPFKIEDDNQKNL